METKKVKRKVVDGKITKEFETYKDGPLPGAKVLRMSHKS